MSGLVNIIPLGGMGEIGKNMYLIEYENEIIIVDSGIKFPDDELVGIDHIIPDYTYLEENSDKIKGLFITHGHEDHIGGIPYLLKRIKIPVYAGRLAMGFIKSKLEEHKILNSAELYEISDESEIPFTNIAVTFFRTTHSIPDSFGIVIRTPLGNVVHTGDFKFDLTPTGTLQDITRMSKIGQDGVLCLLSDSTNSQVPGFSVSEQQIGKNILEIVKKQNGRIVVAMFASNVYRIQQVIKASVATNRKVAIFGRSMERAIGIGQELGYIDAPAGTLIDPTDLSLYKNNELTILCTGSQGEPFAALSRISDGKHRYITVERDDSIIFSSSPIPGNGVSVNRIINKLQKAGANVIDNSLYDIHTSGHGNQEELKLMLQLMKPSYFVPIHGNYRMQIMHQSLALECKIPENHSFILNNGDVLSISSSKAELAGQVQAGSVYVDGSGRGNTERDVLNERKILSESGIISIIILRKGTNIIGKPQVISRGFVYMKDSEELMREIQTMAASFFNNNDSKGEVVIRELISEHIYNQLKRRPIVVIKIIDVD